MIAHPESPGVSEVIQLVDRALYMAKHSGRNRCVGLTSANDAEESHAEPGERLTIRHERVCVVRTPGPRSPDSAPAGLVDSPAVLDAV